MVGSRSVSGFRPTSLSFTYASKTVDFHRIYVGNAKLLRIVAAQKLNIQYIFQYIFRQFSMTAFPFITGISISGSGSTNVGINHFQTGLATDGASLPAWVPSGGLYGWQASPCTLHLRLRTPQTWPLPSVTAGLGAVLHCTRPVIARTLHPTFTTLTAIRCLTCVLCATTTPCVVNPLSPPCVYLIYSAFCHRM